MERTFLPDVTRLDGVSETGSGRFRPDLNTLF